ncbi:unnamed protein product [Coregonus sp. 'balchen']|nr:unnamed protein product [Coregonus sp. 'balchen']
MNSSFESLYSTCSSVQSESVPLLQHNGQVHVHRDHHRSSPMPPHPHTSPSDLQPSPTSPKQRLRRSQPMHILAVRYVCCVGTCTFTHTHNTHTPNRYNSSTSKQGTMFSVCSVGTGDCRKRSSSSGRPLCRPSPTPFPSSPALLSSALGLYLRVSPQAHTMQCLPSRIVYICLFVRLSAFLPACMPTLPAWLADRVGLWKYADQSSVLKGTRMDATHITGSQSSPRASITMQSDPGFQPTPHTIRDSWYARTLKGEEE